MMACKFLRAKNAYGTMEGGDDPFLPLESGTTTYWCIQTGLPMGPDGGLACTGTCGEKRRCFVGLKEVKGKKPQVPA